MNKTRTKMEWLLLTTKLHEDTQFMQLSKSVNPIQRYKFCVGVKRSFELFHAQQRLNPYYVRDFVSHCMSFILRCQTTRTLNFRTLYKKCMERISLCGPMGTPGEWGKSFIPEAERDE